MPSGQPVFTHSQTSTNELTNGATTAAPAMKNMTCRSWSKSIRGPTARRTITAPSTACPQLVMKRPRFRASGKPA